MLKRCAALRLPLQRGRDGVSLGSYRYAVLPGLARELGSRAEQYRQKAAEGREGDRKGGAGGEQPRQEGPVPLPRPFKVKRGEAPPVVGGAEGRRAVWRSAWLGARHALAEMGRAVAHGLAAGAVAAHVCSTPERMCLCALTARALVAPACI